MKGYSKSKLYMSQVCVSSHIHGASLHIAQRVCSRLTRYWYWCRCQNGCSLHATWKRNVRCWRRDGLQGGHQVGQLICRHLLISAERRKEVRTCRSSMCWQSHASVTTQLHVACSSAKHMQLFDDAADRIVIAVLTGNMTYDNIQHCWCCSKYESG